MRAKLSLVSTHIFEIEDFMKKLWVIFLFLSFNCSTAHKQQEVYAILNDIFLDVVDESTYDYYTILPAPNEPRKIRKQKGNYLLMVGDSMPSISEWDISLKTVLTQEKAFTSLLHADKHSQSDIPFTLDYDKIENTGLFTIQKNNHLGNNSLNVVGTIIFYQPLIEGDRACVVTTKFSSPKSGLTELFLLQKENGKWHILSRHDLERW